MKTSSPTSVWPNFWLSAACVCLSACLLGACDPPDDTDQLPAPTDRPIAKGKACELPKDNLHVVDIDGSDDSIFYEVLSDGRLWVFGGGYSSHEYWRAAVWPDEPCLTTITNEYTEVGLTPSGSVTVLYGAASNFGLSKLPASVELDGGIRVQQVTATNDIAVVDLTGSVWLMGKQFADAQAGAFVPYELPEPATKVVMVRGLCALLQSGRISCFAPQALYVGLFGMGLDADLSEATELPAEDVVDFAIGGDTLCYLDSPGVTRCAGSSKGELLGVPAETFQDYERPTFDVVPGLPPLKNIWMKTIGACGLSFDDDLWCWGYTNTTDDPAPTKVSHMPGLVDVAFAWSATCAIRGDHRVVCRGDVMEPYSCAMEDGWYVIEPPGIHCNEEYW